MIKQTIHCLYVFVFGIVMFTACKPKQQQAAPIPPVPVVVDNVKEGNATYFDEYPGVISSLNEVEVRAQVTGYITGIFFQDGQKVKKGQKLYTIDQQQYQAGYDQAVANLNSAKAALDKAQKDADRYNQLLKQDAIAKQKVDYAEADLQAAKMQVAAAQANVASLSANLRYSVITSPMDGTIGFSQVKKGALVSPGSTILNVISTSNPIAVDFNIDEKQVPFFVGLIDKNLSDSTFTIASANGMRYKYPGKISVMDRAVNPQTATLKVRLEFENPLDVLKVGMSCIVRVKNGSEGQRIVIPYKSVVEQMGEYFVYVVGDSSKVEQRKVSLGKNVGDKVIVNKGLDLNDKIVVEGVQKLRPGSVVKPANIGDSTAAKSQAH
ncbi:efflux RND transporter periplasmic adaptor subunit [Pinibacter soli]|uniref:Efflux RND transporter periplasmic adaptor subunit n=1 Tax=Pinibacter soli TaxID=3044211 RepID=A0ABT6R8Z0_9BACT|nr:efflux RND transporter periplasmic adaptor subunit [Pinibacter soli]MDI3319031.1 efflux RND transporter periplasmic adaptor subunit [Pinibacter soli]